MIYVPDDSYPCYVITNHNTIRAYHSMPYQNSTVKYTDYALDMHYMEIEGTQNFSYNYSVSCLSKNKITDDFYYRYDLDSILIIFTIIVLFGFGIPFYLFKKFYRRL